MLTVIIMAAGKGTRMNSVIPKVLHKLSGRTLLQHVLNSVSYLNADKVILITGYEAAQVQASVNTSEPRLRNITFVNQNPQLGTGHAIQEALSEIPNEGTTLILNGDVPLIKTKTLQSLILNSNEKLALLTVEMQNPTGLGRIKRINNFIKGIVEEKDATDIERKIKEVYTGVMAIPSILLKKLVSDLSNNNAQHEYYLTEVASLAVSVNICITSVKPSHQIEVQGVNTQAELLALQFNFNEGKLYD